MESLGESLEAHRRALFGLCYRMTGSAAEADDLVQETFRRALERPPNDRNAPMRPWLIKVATNLCIDALRRRKRERYFGPWLPAPVGTDELEIEPAVDVRYGALESASAAFLLALEALDPKQRAVLVLREVLGLTGPEVAEVLGISAENVRVVLHRARKALEAYDAARNPPTEHVREQARVALRRLMAAFTTGDFDSVRQLLADDCRTITDAGGEFNAAVRVVCGRDAVIELYRNLMRVSQMPTWVEERDYNGLPALAVKRPVKGPREAARFVISVQLDAEGRVASLFTVLARAKLGRVHFPQA